MSDTIIARRRARLLTCLRKHGWASVQEAAAAHDADFDVTTIKGVGVVLGQVMEEWLVELGG